MALNKLMHERNPYRNKKPDFKALSIKYEEFRRHVTQDLRGKVHLDFRNAEALRALTWVLLKDDFGLDVHLPPDRLVPTIPLRLNYILWLEDLLRNETGPVSAIDIGTGASCVYPLLAAKKNGWKFLATESDEMNLIYARKNVLSNNFADQINVLQVDPDCLLADILQDDTMIYSFCMCNPPFFGSSMEAWGMMTSRSNHRPEPKSLNTASLAESVYPGGEVQFVKKLIADSMNLKGRIRFYTTMLGKKSSLAILKDELKKNGITTFGTTEFCQGRTMRWGLAWSFDDAITFPKPPRQQVRESQRKDCLIYKIPDQHLTGDRQKECMEAIVEKIKSLLDELEIDYKTSRLEIKEQTWIITARKNTWTHQRRKRRLERFISKTVAECTTTDPSQTFKSDVEIDSPSGKKPHLEIPDPLIGNIKRYLPAGGGACKNILGQQEENCLSSVIPKNRISDSENSSKSKQMDVSSAILSTCKPDCTSRSVDDSALENIDKKTVVINNEYKQTCTINRMPADPLSSNQIVSPKDCKIHDISSDVGNTGAVSSLRQVDGRDTFLVSSLLSVKESEGHTQLEIKWLKGETREYMHQIMQFFKNRLV